MNGTTLTIFFFLALICVALSITNYLNITIIGDSNALEDFKGNRSGFLEITDESTVVTTYDLFNDPIYKTNALTVQDSPVNIQILNSNTKESSYAPTLNITNTSTENVDINFKTNNNAINNPNIKVTTDTNNSITETDFNSDNTHLRFNVSGNIFGTGLFNFSPYLDNVVTVPATSDDWLRYSLTPNTTYLVPLSIYSGGRSNNNTNCWFFLPRDNVTPGDHINFVFTNVASTSSNSSRKITKWGPPGYVAKNSFIDNWNLGNPNAGTDISNTGGRFGIQQNDSSNSNLTGNFSFGELRNSGSVSNTPAGTLVKFNALDTNPITWAVELDTVQPLCSFYFENNWNPGGTSNKQI